MSNNAPPAIESDSWCRTTSGEKASTTFTWTIEDFLNRPGTKDEAIRSSTFTVSGPNDKKTKWRLQLYPREDREDEEVVLYLISINETFEKAYFSMSILNERNQREFTYSLTTEEYRNLYDNVGVDVGVLLISTEELKGNPQLLPNGNLTVVCDLTVYGPEATLSGSKFPDEKVAPIDNCMKQMSDQFRKKFGDKKFSDVKIVAGSEEFHCHRIILSWRSPVFEAMFQSDMIENTSRRVDMKDIRPEVVREMLYFIYTGVISNDDIMDEIGKDLLGTADQYQLDLLKNKCEEKLCSSLEISNSVELLVLADLHQASKLRSMALRLVARNMDVIVDTDVYKDFTASHPALAVGISKALVFWTRALVISTARRGLRGRVTANNEILGEILLQQIKL